MVATPIFIVCSNTFQLHLLNSSLSFKYGKGGMEVRLGQLEMCKSERQGGNDGRNGVFEEEEEEWCSSSKFLCHPFSFGHSSIYREDKDGKNGVFEEEEKEELPNTLLTLSSSNMYSSASIPQRETDLRKES